MKFKYTSCTRTENPQFPLVCYCTLAGAAKMQHFFYCCEIVTDIDISLSVPGLISVIVFLVIHNFKQVNI